MSSRSSGRANAGCRTRVIRDLFTAKVTSASASRLVIVAVTLGLVGSIGRVAPADDAKTVEPPNVLLIMADDLGFSDLGCYGGEIETPNLDKLAEQGLRFTQFYNAGRCWPTRASLLTGYYPHGVRRDRVDGVPSGGRGKRPDWAPLICEPLASAGYRTYHTGKWHLDGMPIASGFDRSYYLKDQHRFFNPTVHWKDDERLPAVEPESGFYATVALGDHVIECLRDHTRDHAESPFFHYLAFAAPHFPLHALPQDIARYADTYDDGWGLTRRSRFERIRSLGIVSAPLSDVMRDLGPPYDFPDAMETLGPAEVNRPLPWDELTPQQREFQATKMAIHAAMIDRMDREIGRVLDQIRQMDAFDNTLVLFLSDNGASAEIMVRGDGHDRDAPMGSWRSHLCLGPGWSTVSNTPFRYHKTWVHEGGTATPLIAHWPDGIAARGELRETVGHVIDLWPTILDVAGVGEPDITESEVTASGDSAESDSPPRPGISLVPAWSGDFTPERTLWWEHEGNRALRRGDWKITAAGPEGPWELYRLDRDRTETDDLAQRHPDRVESMVEVWEDVRDAQFEMARHE